MATLRVKRAGGAAIKIVIDDGSRSTAVKLNPAAIDRLLWAIRDERSKITPEIPREHPADEFVSATPQPLWLVIPDASGAKMLALREPGFGWLHFLLSPKAANAIAVQLRSPNQRKPRHRATVH